MLNVECRMSNSEPMPARVLVLMLFLPFGLTGAQEVRIGKSAGRVEIRLSRTTESDYLVSRTEPLSFEVAGPAWVRVYSRLRWQAGLQSSERYELILTRGAAERRETLTTGLSATTRGPGGEQYSKWRSFYVKVPPGEQGYDLALGMSASDVAAVRLMLEAPRPGKELKPVGAPFARTIQEDSATADWYQVSDTSRLRLAVTGPARLVIEARLNYPGATYGLREFDLKVDEAGVELLSRRLSVLRSKHAKYVARTTLTPSGRRRVTLDLPEGSHELTVRLKPVKGGTGALRFLVK
jgi:hypothetical protein